MKDESKNLYCCLVLVFTHAAQVVDPNQSREAMATMSKTPRRLPAGELTVCLVSHNLLINFVILRSVSVCLDVKIDWCNTKVDGKELDPETVHTEFSKALNATGRHIFLNLCRGYSYPPPPYTVKVANSWRGESMKFCPWNS